jgi:transcriptional regulator with XRE-family HTH domain
MAKPNVKFGRMIIFMVRKQMEEDHMSQAELARRSGVARTRINELLNGNAVGSLEMWQRIWDAL